MWTSSGQKARTAGGRTCGRYVLCDLVWSSRSNAVRHKVFLCFFPSSLHFNLTTTLQLSVTLQLQYNNSTHFPETCLLPPLLGPVSFTANPILRHPHDSTQRKLSRMNRCGGFMVLWFYRLLGFISISFSLSLFFPLSLSPSFGVVRVCGL